MEDIKKEHLQFVLRHWQAGRFHPGQAWKRFLAAHADKLHAPGRTTVRRTWSYALATALAVMAIGFFLFSRESRKQTVIPVAENIRTVILPDGTEAILAPGATLAFRRHGFGRRDRTVQLEGQSFFNVTLDKDHPFEISAGQGFVRVLGTRFQVSTDSSGAAVDVVDGSVLFSAKTAENGLVLTRGMHAELPAGAPCPILAEPSTPNPAAWATHTFIYDDTPLDDVLQELSVHFGCTLSTDASGRRLTGEFDSRDVTEIVSLIEAALGIQIKTAL